MYGTRVIISQIANKYFFKLRGAIPRELASSVSVWRIMTKKQTCA